MSYPPTPQRKACDCSDPCISTDDVYYAGPNLPNSGVNTSDLLTEVIEKLDAIYAVPTLQKVTETSNYTTLPIIADSFVKIGGNGSNILLDNGTTIPISTIGGNQNLEQVLSVGNRAYNEIVLTFPGLGETNFNGFKTTYTDYTGRNITLFYADGSFTSGIQFILPSHKVDGRYTLATLDDIPAAPYKVYTALLTQGGGDVPGTCLGYGDIDKGFTYTIVANPDANDLTVYGSPDNNVGTSFVANQSAYLPYTSSLELSFNEGAPIVTVLENTIGNIWFTYFADGEYQVNSSDLFIIDKTWGICPANTGQGNTNVFGLIDVTAMNLATSDTSDILVNNLLSKTPIEIRVYN